MDRPRRPSDLPRALGPATLRPRRDTARRHATSPPPLAAGGCSVPASPGGPRQSTNEELETTNEELQSTVEELETTNEELQSTNEELETMNEELQSTNEELETVNEELRQRGSDLSRSNTFLGGILRSVPLAVIVLDEE